MNKYKSVVFLTINFLKDIRRAHICFIFDQFVICMHQVV